MTTVHTPPASEPAWTDPTLEEAKAMEFAFGNTRRLTFGAASTSTLQRMVAQFAERYEKHPLVPYYKSLRGVQIVLANRMAP
jgi:hypothetical protein